MRNSSLPISLALALSLAGCATMNDSERRVATGAGVGAASGAVIGSFSGNAGAGALIGTAVGAMGGVLYDQHKKSEEEAYYQGRRDAHRRY